MKKVENSFAVTGFVGKDAEIRQFTTASKAVFSLAISRTEQNGERVSSFINAGTTQGNYENREANRRYFAQNTWDGRTDYKKYMQSYYGQAGVDFALERNWTLG